MMKRQYISRLAGALAVLVAVATCTASCASKKAQSPGMDLANMQISPATTASCEIDAVKMCQDEGGSSTPSSKPSTVAMPSSYGPSNTPESIEFQIPAGQVVKLMCYYDPQHSSVYRADATAQSPLTGNSVEYMKKQGFCIKK
jgi:hypothetical protein